MSKTGSKGNILVFNSNIRGKKTSVLLPEPEAFREQFWVFLNENRIHLFDLQQISLLQLEY